MKPCSRNQTKSWNQTWGLHWNDTVRRRVGNSLANLNSKDNVGMSELKWTELEWSVAVILVTKSWNANEFSTASVANQYGTGWNNAVCDGIVVQVWLDSIWDVLVVKHNQRIQAESAKRKETEIRICFGMSRGWQKVELITIVWIHISDKLGLVSRIREIKRKRNFKAVCEPGKARNWIRLTGIVEMNRNQRLVLTAACCIGVDTLHVQR